MIRILQVFGRMDRGGAETMIMNLYRNIDRTQVQFDFVVHTEDECAFDDEIIKLGGRIFRVPRFVGKNFFSYIKAWNKLLDENSEWKIIHGHVRSTASIYLTIARKKGLYSISHSHNTSTESGINGIAKKLLQLPIRFIADSYFACSLNAGEWLFGKKICSSDKFYLLNNSIDASKFRYSEEIRKKIRNQFQLDNRVVIGNISRFNPQKNHEFLIEIFKEIHKKEKNAVLLLVGDGEDRKKIEKKVFDFGIEENVHFLGVRSDIEKILQALDLVLFPSLFEGLPVSIIEAQAAGVPCLLSDTISSECKLTDCVSFFPLTKTAAEWAEVALERAKLPHYDTFELIKENKYDINHNADWLLSFYKSKLSI